MPSLFFNNIAGLRHNLNKKVAQSKPKKVLKCGDKPNYNLVWLIQILLPLDKIK